LLAQFVCLSELRHKITGVPVILPHRVYTFTRYYCDLHITQKTSMYPTHIYAIIDLFRTKAARRNSATLDLKLTLLTFWFSVFAIAVNGWFVHKLLPERADWQTKCKQSLRQCH